MRSLRLLHHLFILFSSMVFEKMQDIFSGVLGVPSSDIKLETSPENTPSWDSLNAIVLITEIEKAFNIRFTYDEAMAVKNVGDGVALVEQKLRA